MSAQRNPSPRAPASPAGERSGLVRATVLPSPPPAPVAPPEPAGDEARALIDELVRRVREMDAPYRGCGSPSCPRRARARATFCAPCLKVRHETSTASLVAARWTLDPVGGGKRWLDPITGESHPRTLALLIARRDAKGTP